MNDQSSITRSPLCWPNNVPRTAPGKRGSPQFDERSISQASKFVVEEINRLNKRRWDWNDDDVIVSTNLALSKRDGTPLSSQPEPADSGAAVYFKLRFWRNGKEFSRPCVLTCDKWRKVSDNLWAIGKDIEAQRARERWGSTTTEQAFQGYLAIPERCGGCPWWETLGIKPDANQDAVKAAYKAKANIAHPDKPGGSEAAFKILDEAYQQAMAQFRS